MFRSYTNQNPTWADGRYNFFLFVVRAHNTVNKRLDKPRPGTVLECIESLKMLTKNKAASQFRNSYINYLLSNWAREGGGEGMIQMGNVREMRKINDQYWNLREISFDSLSFQEADILTPIATSPRMLSPYSQTPVYSAPSGPAFGFKLTGGKFSFGKR